MKYKYYLIRIPINCQTIVAKVPYAAQLLALSAMFLFVLGHVDALPLS
jgi:hypothetical protein